MRPYLNDYMQTLSNRRQARVSDLLEEARVGKSQLAAVVGGIESTIAGGNALLLDRVRPETRIRSTNLSLNVSSMRGRIEELFRVSNAIALLLNSHSALLASDIKALEDELLSMEKMVFNYAFLLADNQAYDYAFLESFTDALNRDNELTALPDRSALPFGPSEQAFVHTENGTLSLPESVLNSHGMEVQVLKSNAGAFTIEQTSLRNMLTMGMSRGWKQVMRTPGNVNTPLPEGQNRPGAQVVLEFTLTEPAPSSEIQIMPYADLSVELLSVRTFKSEDDNVGSERLDGTRLLDRPLTVYFPMESVQRFHLVLNQPIFHRVDQHENTLEFRYHKMLSKINEQRVGLNGTYKRMYFVNTIEQSILLDVMGKGDQSISLPATNLTPDHGPMSASELVMAFRFDRPSLWHAGAQDDSYIIFNLLENNRDLEELDRNNTTSDLQKNMRILEDGNPVSQVVTKAVDAVGQDSHTYYYNLGLHYVGIGVESPGFKGVYVSKTLPAPGDIGELRIKTEQENYHAMNSARHSKVLTSVEYSVSNKSNPENESDWRPILPVGTAFVEAERLFVDEDGNASIRFPADEGELLNVYRNGYAMSLTPGVLDVVRGVPGTVIGFKISAAVRAPEDIFTIDYYPAEDQTVVSFEDDDYAVPPLVAAHDNNGAGEGFLGTKDRNTITLNHKPYIDPNMVSQDVYQPIVVQLEDGTIAENLTDYRTSRSVSLPAAGYYFIHSGDTIMFNQPIRTAFRVYYNYLQNNVRFRTVLRCNVQDFVSPKVDFVHLKAKTRIADVR